MKYEGIDDCLMHKGAAAKGQQLGRQLTCCGTECTECGFYENVCAGCNESCGRVFHAPEGKACPIYDCAVNRKKRTSCAQCKIFPVKSGRRRGILRYRNRNLRRAFGNGWKICRRY